MYSLKVPFRDFKDNPQNETVYFNLSEREIFKLSGEFALIFNWRDEVQGDPRDLDPQEVIPYFTAFEQILLEAWGEPSPDGLHFRKGGRYDFEESACFNATLMMFVTDPALVVKFLEEIVPKGMEDVLQTQAANVAKFEETNPEAAATRNDNSQSPAELQREIDELRRKINQKDEPSTEG